MAINESTARTMAKHWRAGDSATRAIIECCITARDGWDVFRYGRDGQLMARIDPSRPRNADCHFYSTGAGLVHA